MSFSGWNKDIELVSCMSRKIEEKILLKDLKFNKSIKIWV